MRRAIVAGLAAVSLVAAADGVYKWVDEKGVTHYSESPPPDDGKGKKATKLDIKSSAPPDSGKAVDWKQKDLDSRSQDVQKKEEARAREEADAKVAAEREVLCQQAMRQNNLYQQQTPVFTMNERGERVYVEDEDRVKKIEDAQEKMRKNCD